ncbi:MAG: VOC family protein [Planctomycetota bacterium]|nr:VOC family protein [Planctomycetota bacterium]
MAKAAIPCLRYKDAHAAIDWLCEAFGFKKHLLVPADDGGVAHAQLVRGETMVMLGAARDDEFGSLCALAQDAGGSTQSTYFVVSAIDAHYRQAVEAGAEVVIEIRDEDYGGRGYSVKDLEGNLWNFGSYDPWADPT